jgi:peroxiredoxin
MIEPGEHAPSFTLPAVRDGEIVDLDLDSVLGSEVVILAFYPGDFNPACSGTETGLDELDLFTMQKDVQVLAISGDSVYSHRAFAEQYGLRMPLLSDTDGTVAEAYGVSADDGAGHLATRAVVVVDHAETVQYTWTSDRSRAVPTAEKIKDAVEGIGSGETAASRYRVGHAHYVEGRRAFTSAMKAYENNEWMMAQADFAQACEEFDEAGEEFNTAVRFAEREQTRTYFEHAEQKSELLWRAADWLADSANAFASGEGAEGDSLRRDAEAPLETARDLHDPPDPDEFPPEQHEENESLHPLADEGGPAATLDADIDDQVTDTAADSESAAGHLDEQSAEASAGDLSQSANTEPGDQPAVRSASDAGERAREGANNAAEASSGDEAATMIDDEELEEITAELEAQTETAESSDPEPDDGAVPDEPEGDDAEFDLTDPTEADEETSNDDNGDHGVPDSL